jgi:hypothetical protein
MRSFEHTPSPGEFAKHAGMFGDLVESLGKKFKRRPSMGKGVPRARYGKVKGVPGSEWKAKPNFNVPDPEVPMPTHAERMADASALGEGDVLEAIKADEGFAINQLPSRLGQIGAAITSGGASIADMMALSKGLPPPAATTSAVAGGAAGALAGAGTGKMTRDIARRSKIGPSLLTESAPVTGGVAGGVGGAIGGPFTLPTYLGHRVGTAAGESLRDQYLRYMMSLVGE